MREEKSVSDIQRKRQASKASYVKSKNDHEHALLRLRPGSLARLDAARAPLGLSRSAYVESLLEAACQSQSSPAANLVLTPSSISDEFEALFGGGA
ncbi:hypothetical protein ABIB38_002244 [Massilia sp. UYP11]|uniref:hypothetical protein n=1 Tax=Massilia sp. UYP11 TaxID=1756385 RepID=UPI003D213795